MGEGGTPLVPAHGDWGCRLYWKERRPQPHRLTQGPGHYRWPSPGAREVKAPRLVIASTGSAALAAAAYCARAGLPCVVIVPRGTPSGARLAPIALLGAHLVELQGTFVQIERLLDTLEHDPSWDDVTTTRVANPFQAEAPKTIAYEIVGHLGRVPDWLVVPVGGGATIFGIWRGFQDSLQTGARPGYHAWSASSPPGSTPWRSRWPGSPHSR